MIREKEKESSQDHEQALGTETYEQWIRSEGLKWRHVDPLGPKWLGGNVVRLLFPSQVCC